MRCSLLQETAKAQQTRGKGMPAKFALTWQRLNEFPQFNVLETDKPCNAWTKFAPTEPIKTLRAAEELLGWSDRAAGRGLPPRFYRGGSTGGPQKTARGSDGGPQKVSRGSHGGPKVGPTGGPKKNRKLTVVEGGK